MFWFFTVALQILVDYYVLYNWQKFVKRQGYSPVLYKLPWVIAGLVLLGTFYSSPILLSLGFDAPAKRTFQLITVLWFLPKLLISLVLLLKDIGRLFILIYRKYIHKESELLTSPIDQAEEIPSSPRRDFLEKVAWTAAAAPFAIATNGMFRTAFDFQSYYQTISIAGLPSQLSGLKIVQISDIHAGSFGSHRPMQEVRRLIDSHKPDLIVITGDYVNFRADELKVIYQEFEKLKAPLGVFGSMGNHDHYTPTSEEHELLKKGIRSAGINLLVNSNSTIKVDGATLNIAGIDNTGLGQNFGRLDEAMNGLNTSNPTILLAHDPTVWNKQVRGKLQVDLMLAGHTHGGQVGVHLLGEDYSFARVVYEQWAGLYSDKDQSLYVNRGIGMVGPPIRIAIEPEITVLTLEKPESKG